MIRIEWAGICSTDHGLIAGMYPFTGIPGHEFVGTVEAGPEGLMGRRVVGVISASCRVCPTCQAGRTSHCPSRTVLGIERRHGVFAEYATLPSVNLSVVPDSVPSEVAVFTEPLAAALEILEQVHVKPTDRVLVVGPGKLGQLIARVLAQVPCGLTVVARSAHSLERLPKGITTTMPPDVGSAAFDIVVECTGKPDGFSVARAAVRPGGVLVLKSTHGDETPFNLTMAVVDEITVIGSRCGPFPPALRLLESGRIDPTSLVDLRFPIDQAVEALEASQRRGTCKVLLDCSG